MAQKYCCKACDYVYNPQKGDVEGGVAPGVAFEDLPENAKAYVRFIEEQINCPIRIVSNGPRRESTMFR